MASRSTSTARVVEIGDETAGIAVPDRAGTVRFFSAQGSFDKLDGRVFRGFEEASRAARNLTRQRRSRERIGPPRHDAPGTAEGTTELVLAAPGPFLLPV